MAKSPTWINPNTQARPGCWRGGNRPLERLRLRHQTPEARDKSRSWWPGLDAQSSVCFVLCIGSLIAFNRAHGIIDFRTVICVTKTNSHCAYEEIRIKGSAFTFAIGADTFYLKIRMLSVASSFWIFKALKVPWHLTYSFFLRPYKFKLWVTQEIILLSSSFFKLSVHHNFLREKELLDETLCYKSQYSSTKVILKTPRKIIDNGKWSQGRNWLLGL